MPLDDSHILHQARRQIRRVLADLERDQRGLESPDLAPGRRALADAAECAGRLLQSLEESLQKADTGSSE